MTTLHLSYILILMTLISMDSISKTLGEGPLFSNLSFGIEEGEHIGLVGPNGCGKSTLLRILAGLLVVDDGELAKKRMLRVSMLDQVPRWETGDSIRDFLLRSKDPTVRLVDRYERTLMDHSAPVALVTELSHRMESEGGFTLEHRFASILSELGIDDTSLPMDTLSGGMVKKVALARCLTPDAELLLLDEPTNHLDLDTIEWLEKKLAKLTAAFVMVSHDRWFLDAVCNSIMDIDGGKAYKYAGDYSEYLRRKAERAALIDAREQRREAILRVELEWLKRGPKARSIKDKKRVGKIHALEDGRPEAADPGTGAFTTAQRRLGRKVLEISSLSKSWEGVEVLKPFSYTISTGARIGVIGPNGSGKSTLLDLIAGRIESDTGTVDRGETVSIGYFDQTGLDAGLELNILNYIRESAEWITMEDGVRIQAEQFLERFGFPRAMHGQRIGKLSGGERRRLHLIRILSSSPNVLLLDEPTNDIDITTIALLEEFLSTFTGSIIMVSHDRAFLETLSDTLWILDGSGGIEPFVGPYSAWREQRYSRSAASVEPSVRPPKKGAEKPKTKNQGDDRDFREAEVEKKLSFKEKKELETLLPEIDRLEEEKKTLELRFADPTGSLAKDGFAYGAASSRYAELETLIERKTLRWEELAARADL